MTTQQPIAPVDEAAYRKAWALVQRLYEDLDSRAGDDPAYAWMRRWMERIDAANLPRPAGAVGLSKK